MSPCWMKSKAETYKLHRNQNETVSMLDILKISRLNGWCWRLMQVSVPVCSRATIAIPSTHVSLVHELLVVGSINDVVR